MPYNYYAFFFSFFLFLWIMQRQAKVIAKKIEDLRQGSGVGKQKREASLLDQSQKDVAKLSLQQEKLEELQLKFQQLQCEHMLKQKVIFYLDDILVLKL